MLMLYLPGILLAYVVADALNVFEESAVSDDVPPPTDVNELGAGDDVFIGTDNIDIVRGGDGNDDLAGDGANDELFGQGGNDTAYGGAGDDLLTDTLGADTLFGDLGDDTIDATDASDATPEGDLLFGGLGEDTLIGDGLDTMTGGQGDDTFEISEVDVISSAARITDAEDGETIRIAVAQAATGETLATNLASNGSDLEVSFRGDVLVILEGVTSADGLNLELRPNILT